MSRIRIIIVAALAGAALAFAPSEYAAKRIAAPDAPHVNWLSWEEAMSLSQKEKKKILFAVYTEWCGWCKRMDQATFDQPDIANYINTHFYAVKFDAEQREELVYKGKTYKLVKTGKRHYHELAAELLRGQMSFPSIAFLDEELELIQTIVGYKPPQQFEKIATYFAADHYLKVPWSNYEKNYQPVLIKD